MARLPRQRLSRSVSKLLGYSSARSQKGNQHNPVELGPANHSPRPVLVDQVTMEGCHVHTYRSKAVGGTCLALRGKFPDP